MRCHAKYGPFRCELEMNEHLDDRHVFTVEWDDEGEGIGRTEELDLIAYVDGPAPAVSYPPQQVAADETPRPVQTLDAPTPEQEIGEGATRGVASDGRRWWLNPETGGIVYETIKVNRCGICNHAWHETPCEAPIQPGEYATACGCMTASA